MWPGSYRDECRNAFIRYCHGPVVLKCEIGLISRNQNEMRNRPFFNNLKANW